MAADTRRPDGTSLLIGVLFAIATILFVWGSFAERSGHHETKSHATPNAEQASNGESAKQRASETGNTLRYTGAAGITEIGPYIWRTSLPESDVIPVTFKKAQSRGVKTIALMYANDDAFSKSGFDVMKAAAEKLGLKILTIETFGSKDTDFSAQAIT